MRIKANTHTCVIAAAIMGREEEKGDRVGTMPCEAPLLEKTRVFDWQNDQETISSFCGITRWFRGLKQRWSGRLAGMIRKLESRIQQNATKEAEYEKAFEKSSSTIEEIVRWFMPFCYSPLRDRLPLDICL